jgi:flagellar basal body rod protein FlgB
MNPAYRQRPSRRFGQRRRAVRNVAVRRLRRALDRNAVNLEDEMLKVAANQMDFQAATTLYTRSLGLLKTAIGKR